MANFNTGLTKQQIITALTKALESMSEQEVQSAISTAISGKQDILSFDNTPTSDSSNPVTSGGIYTDQQRQDAAIEAGALRYEDSGIIRLNQLSWSQTSSGSGMWIADCYTAQNIDTIVSALIMSFGALKPAEIKTLFTYIPSSVSGMHTVRLVCDQNLASISSNPTLYLRVFGYGYQTSSLRSDPASLMQAGRLDSKLTDDIDNYESETSGGEEMR